MWQVLAGLLNANNNLKNNELQNYQIQNDQQRQNILNKRAGMLQAQNAIDAQRPNIDMQSIINGVFTGKQKNRNPLPTGYLGV